MKSKDPHRKHQQLMQELSILNAAIRMREKQMEKGKGKLDQHEWEKLVREIRQLNTRKTELNRKIKELP